MNLLLYIVVAIFGFTKNGAKVFTCKIINKKIIAQKEQSNPKAITSILKQISGPSHRFAPSLLPKDTTSDALLPAHWWMFFTVFF